MKKCGYGIVGLILFFVACTSDKEAFEENGKLATIRELVDNHVLLKQVNLSAETWSFCFENQTVDVSESAIEQVSQDVANWKTTVLFKNRQLVTIPTLGTGFEKFVGNVELNPSGLNPLAATVQVALPTQGRIKVVVRSKKGAHEPDVEHLFKAYTDRQSLAVLGLYANYNNQVDLIYYDKNGEHERGRTTLTIQTEGFVTRAFQSLRVVTCQPNLMEPGMNLINSPGVGDDDTSVPYMVDADGEVRWILILEQSELAHSAMQGGVTRLQNGNYLAGNANKNEILELDVFGQTVKKWNLTPLGYQYHHEVMQAQNGNFLATVIKTNAKCSDGKTPRINDHIIEFNPATNSLVHEWDLVNTLDSARNDNIGTLPGMYFGQSKANWAHNNAIMDWGEDYLATARYQGIFKFNKKGNLAWIIAPHKKWREQYKRYLLTPLDKDGNPITDEAVINGDKSTDDFDWPWGVHAPVYLPNGHVIAFDNGFFRNFISRPLSDNNQYSRAVEYEVDEVKRTVRQVWQYGKDRPDCYGPARSSVQYLPQTKHVLFCSAMQNKLSNGSYGAHVIEVDRQTNEVVYELELSSAVFHRAIRIGLYPDNL